MANGSKWLVASILLALSVGLALSPPSTSAAQLDLKTAADYEKYVRLTEQRIDEELQIAKRDARFLSFDFGAGDQGRRVRESLKRGEIHVESMRTRENNREIKADNGLIHHWTGAAFVPGVKLETLEKWLKNYSQHERYFPEIEKSKLIAGDGQTFQFFYRLKRKKVITVVYNTEYTARYLPISVARLASKSVATRIAQLADAGTSSETEMHVGDDGGYLWRLNSYWRFEEQDGGVYVECESISLSRDIPFGVGWMIRGLVESVPRESLVSTLTSLRDGVRKATPNQRGNN